MSDESESEDGVTQTPPSLAESSDPGPPDTEVVLRVGQPDNPESSDPGPPEVEISIKTEGSAKVSMRVKGPDGSASVPEGGQEAVAEPGDPGPPQTEQVDEAPSGPDPSQ